jgi:hypothetical protein
MLHRQLNLKLPDCPYVWDHHDLRQTYGFRQESSSRDKILCDIRELLVSSGTDDNTMVDDSLFFLETLTQDDSNIFTTKHYSRIRQTIPQHKKDLMINFHASAYNDDNGRLINKEFSSVVSWSVIPITGDVRTHQVGYTINRNTNPMSRDTMMNNDMARCIDSKTYKGHADNEHEKMDAVVKAQRTSMRNFIVRDIEPEKVQKRDITVDTSIQTHQTKNTVEPRKHQIDMNNNTRASGQLIRDRLMSSYKAHRIRNNPDAIKQQLRVDLSLRHTANHTADTLNKNYRALERDVDKEPFDYTYDHVGVKTYSAIHKFNPVISGRIGINAENNETIYFVSVMHHKTNLHITLHELLIK